MKYFVKLNIVSMLYAFLLFVPIRVMGEFYRISRLTGLEFQTVETMAYIIIAAEFVIGTLLLIFITKKLLIGRKANFWTIVLWVPYFVLFTFLIASMFPITYQGDMPSPGTGMVIIGLLMVYPLYILVINFLSLSDDGEDVRTV